MEAILPCFKRSGFVQAQINDADNFAHVPVLRRHQEALSLPVRLHCRRKHSYSDFPRLYIRRWYGYRWKPLVVTKRFCCKGR